MQLKFKYKHFIPITLMNDGLLKKTSIFLSTHTDMKLKVNFYGDISEKHLQKNRYDDPHSDIFYCYVHNIC